MLGEPLLDYQMTGSVAGPQGNFDPERAPHNNYPRAEEDTWVAIAVRAEKEWAGFRRALGNPGWTTDTRFEDLHGRVRHSRELDQHVAD